MLWGDFLGQAVQTSCWRKPLIDQLLKSSAFGGCDFGYLFDDPTKAKDVFDSKGKLVDVPNR